ncbi:sigma-70 family RNA polymerase sigma factor [Lysobacter sp. LF1]|uniref:Sigma-70 family RNA polymerase sigma factor n=1 Tax=Lysobacter stagni TaxID=3045172 RepID=A0ABT6XB37_9GAMM|nr:sigma-70 family RNA polymerase sigma factor [Lysobacter sp. LF1]MDI9237358.1 sigma-70 family RNA polymerase sigma factor [Lysobacter sp. LF1]
MPPPPSPEPVTPATTTAPRSSFAIDVPDGLLARARNGDRAAFEQLYRWFERPVFNLALRMLGGAHGSDREEAADVLQETMIKVYGKIGDYRGGDAGGPFWGWVRQIAVNEALMRLRSNRRHHFDVPLDGDDMAVDPGPLPSAAADAATLSRALARLPSSTRSVLWLYHAEGYTHEEIAALMQRTPSFSKSQLSRGGRRLRELLEPETAHA